jgi:hypothetical protein
VNPASACAIANLAVGFGCASFASSLHVRGVWQLVELLPRQLEHVLDLAEDAQRPRREIRIVLDRAGVQHRPLLGQVLARR